VLDWPARRWLVAVASAAATILLIALPTALIATPWFGREIPPTPWAWPVLLVTGVLSGLVMATYVARPEQPVSSDAEARSRIGVVGGFLAYLAVGCPVCNKIVLIALGSTGAVQWFAPVQPLLAIAGIGLVAYALKRRIDGERSCPVLVSAGGSRR